MVKASNRLSRGFAGCCGSHVLAGLISVNVLVWIAISVMGMCVGNDSRTYSRILENLTLDASWQFALAHPWTPVTYMVTQLSLLHLLFNVLWLYWFGRIAVTTCGNRGLLVGYIGGGLAGGLLYLLFLAGDIIPHGTYLCGASAAVLSIMGMVLITRPNLEMSLLLFGRVKLKWLTLGCICLTFFGTSGGYAGGPVAHLGGLAFGLLYGIISIWRQGVKNSGREGKKRDMKINRNPKIKNRHREPEDYSSERISAMVEATRGRLKDPKRREELLTKIRISGYSSLNERERAELHSYKD